MKTIYLAGGCFWGVEAYFQKVKGVVETEVGYANGNTRETEYEKLALTDHAETTKIVYDESVMPLEGLLERLFTIIDPTSINRQGGDFGRQYRTGIYYVDEESREIARKALDGLQKQYVKKIQVELEELKNYVTAEEYHQDYLVKNPKGYCHVDLSKVY